MELHLVIGEVIEALQNEQLEHHDPVKRRPACIAAVFRLAENDSKNGREDVPVDICFQSHKRIFELGEPFQKEMFVEKSERIDVFHDSSKGVNETAVIYEIQGFS